LARTFTAEDAEGGRGTAERRRSAVFSLCEPLRPLR
jgi:hypothetical protein